MSRDLEDVLREIGELSNIHADRKKLRANLREIRDHRLAYYNQSNEKELQAGLSGLGAYFQTTGITDPRAL